MWYILYFYGFLHLYDTVFQKLMRAMQLSSSYDCGVHSVVRHNTRSHRNECLTSVLFQFGINVIATFYV